MSHILKLLNYGHSYINANSNIDSSGNDRIFHLARHSLYWNPADKNSPPVIMSVNKVVSV